MHCLMLVTEIGFVPAFIHCSNFITVASDLRIGHCIDKNRKVGTKRRSGEQVNILGRCFAVDMVLDCIFDLLPYYQVGTDGCIYGYQANLVIHGFFFWVFTRSRPVFALKLFYAYAGAPDWYIPTRQFMIVALGPLVIIGVAGMLLMLLVPESWVVLIVLMVAFNTGGSVGDLLIFTRLLKLSPTGLANDTGDVMSFYERPSTLSHP